LKNEKGGKEGKERETWGKKSVGAHAPVEFLEQLAMERIGRLQVQFILRVETRARNVVHARPERLRSILQIRFRFDFFFKKKPKRTHTTVESAHV